MAPEILKRQQPHFSCDIWSLGITVIEMTDGQPPSVNIPILRAMRQIVCHDVPSPTFSDPPSRSPNLLHFVYQCLQKDPTKRPSAYQLLSHLFLKGYRDYASLRDQILETLLRNYNKSIKAKNSNIPALNFPNNNLKIGNVNNNNNSSDEEVDGGGEGEGENEVEEEEDLGEHLPVVVVEDFTPKSARDITSEEEKKRSCPIAEIYHRISIARGKKDRKTKRRM